MHANFKTLEGASKNAGYCVAPWSKMLIHLGELRFSTCGDALSASFLEAPREKDTP
jgi:hypothetical protein